MRFFADRSILQLAVAQTILWAGTFYLFPALLLRWEQSLTFDRDILTALFTGALLLTAIFSPLAGHWIDRGRGAFVLTGGAGVAGFALIILSLVNTPSIFIAVWAVLGICMAAALYDPCFALVTKARGEGARAAITTITLFAGFAGTVSFPLAHMLSDFLDWRLAAVLFGALILLISAPLTWSASKALEREACDRSSSEPNSGAKAFGRLSAAASSSTLSTMRSAPFLLIAGAFAVMALIHGMIVSHFLPMLDEQGLDPDIAVILIACIGPMQVAGRVLMTFFGQNARSTSLVILSFLAICLAQAILVATFFLDRPRQAMGFDWPILSLLILFVSLQGAAYGVTSILRPAVTRELLGEVNFGTIAGGVTLASFLATAAAPYAGTVFWSVGGYALLSSSAVFFGAIGIVCFFFAEKLAKRF